MCIRDSLDPMRRVLGVIRPTVECIGNITQSRHVGVPVSYTHLDVYKRQDVNNTDETEKPVILYSGTPKKDVYKRQLVKPVQLSLHSQISS